MVSDHVIRRLAQPQPCAVRRAQDIRRIFPLSSPHHAIGGTDTAQRTRAVSIRAATRQIGCIASGAQAWGRGLKRFSRVER